MALTRRALKAMGIDEEKIDEIIALYTETVEGLPESSDIESGQQGRVLNLIFYIYCNSLFHCRYTAF